MMELVPAYVGKGIVLNAVNACVNPGTDCRLCADLAVGVHNWLLTTKIQYLVVDFQDEKDVCHAILVELLQLRKRSGIPFLFVGLMDRPKKILSSFAYSGYPFFATPEEAVLHLGQMHPDRLAAPVSDVVVDQAIPCARARHAAASRPEADGGAAANATAQDEESGASQEAQASL